MRVSRVKMSFFTPLPRKGYRCVEIPNPIHEGPADPDALHLHNCRFESGPGIYRGHAFGPLLQSAGRIIFAQRSRNGPAASRGRARRRSIGR